MSIFDEDINEIIGSGIEWGKFHGKTILVSGAAGFIGSYIVNTLMTLITKKNEDIRLYVIVRDKSRAEQKFHKFTELENFNIVEWDLQEVEIPALPEFDYIFHAASQASPKFYGIDPVGTILPNTVGTASLLNLLKKNIKRNEGGFLFISTSEVYGNTDGVTSLKETDYGTIDPTAVRSCYSESKRLGETLCVSWSHQFGAPVYIVRPFHTYGPGLKRDDGRVFADFVFNVLDGKDIIMNSDGTAVRAFCYISDAIVGIFKVLQDGETRMPYNLANKNGELSIKELAKLLTGLSPEKKLRVQFAKKESGSYLQSKVQNSTPNTESLESLGWSAKITPKVGFSKMIKSYEVN